MYQSLLAMYHTYIMYEKHLNRIDNHKNPNKYLIHKKHLNKTENHTKIIFSSKKEKMILFFLSK